MFHDREGNSGHRTTAFAHPPSRGFGVTRGYGVPGKKSNLDESFLIR